MRPRPFTNPGYAAALAKHEALKEKKMSELRAKVASQQQQIIDLRKQLALSVRRERENRKPVSEAAE